jgi:hypothetical protein
MLTIHDQDYRLCDGLSRREWLRVGSLGLFVLSSPSLLQARRAGVLTVGNRPGLRPGRCGALPGRGS